MIGKHLTKLRFYDVSLGRMLAKNPVNYTDPTGEMLSIVIGALVGGVFGVGGSALSQIWSGEDFSFRKAFGAAANGAIVGGVRGALIGSGVGASAALAADFGAGTLGSAAEQLIGTGQASVKESLKDGLINAVTGRIYGNGKIKSLGEALGRGAAAGGVSSGLNYLSDAFTPRPGRLGGSALNGLAGMMLMGAGSTFGRDPRRGCGTGNRDVDWIGVRTPYGYQYNGNESDQKESGYSALGFVREVLVGAVTGGLASAAFYGAGKAVQALRGSIYNKKAIDSFDLELKEALDTLNESGLRPGQTEISKSKIQYIVDNYDATKAQSSVYTDSTGRYLVEGHHTTVANTILNRGTSMNMNQVSPLPPSTTNVYWSKKPYELWKTAIKIKE